MKDFALHQRTKQTACLQPSAIGRATGKIILIGEHAVVYHQPAIAMPFKAVEVVATVSKSTQPLTIACDFYEGLATHMPEILQSLKHAIFASLRYIHQINSLHQTTFDSATILEHGDGEETIYEPYLHIDVQSTIPAERGMGSSAAVSVAVVRAIFSYFTQSLSPELLWEIVQASETIAHGNPSGIDTVTTSGELPVYYIKGQAPTPINMDLTGVLVVADTGETGQTLEAVQAVSRLVTAEKNNPNTLDFSPSAMIERLGALTEHAKYAITRNDVASLGNSMTEAHMLLKQLSVSNDTLDRLVDVALASGAVGAKLTGGGRGGCMVALVESIPQAERVAHALREAGARQTWLQSFSADV